MLKSVANFNVVLKACGLEALAYLGSDHRWNGRPQEEDLSTLVRRLVSKDFEIVASMRAEFGERGGRGSMMMQHLRDNCINLLVYETTDAEAELLGVDWVAMMLGSGTYIKVGLDKDGVGNHEIDACRT